MNERAADELQQPVPRVSGNILCVDDEPNILSSLRRLFRASGYAVRVAESGAAALAQLDEEPADLVISDMRMPEMNGAQFLQQVRQRWPQTVRFLLTGQADVASIIEAINRGEIYRYITKPWDDDDIVLLVRHALDHRRLEQLARRQNEALAQLNATLEHKVAARTDELAQANERLKQSFVVSLKVLAGLIEFRGDGLAGHARRVAVLARKLALQMGLEDAVVQEVFIAGLLHEIGKIGFSDALLATPVASMNPAQLDEYRLHPARAEQLLMPLTELRGAVAVIAAQLERFDGAGHPNKLRGASIPVGARILALASDYDNLQLGVLAMPRLPALQARTVIDRASGRRYDPQVVDAFLAHLRGDVPTEAAASLTGEKELVTSAHDLISGMVLARDLIAPSGLMMLSADHQLDDLVIRKVLEFERSSGVALTIHIKSDPDAVKPAPGGRANGAVEQERPSPGTAPDSAQVPGMPE